MPRLCQPWHTPTPPPDHKPLYDPSSRLGLWLGGGLGLVEPLAPGVGLVLLARGVVELHEPLLGFRQAGRGVWGELGLALLQALVALQQQRLGLRWLLLEQEVGADAGELVSPR